MNDYDFLRSIYEVNVETKRVGKIMKSTSSEEKEAKMKDYIEMLYDLKKKALSLVLFSFKHTIEAHSYKNRSYWLIRLSGFEYHLQYVKIPKHTNEMISVEHKDYNTVKEIGIGNSIGNILEYLNVMSQNADFENFQERFFYSLEKDIRPFRHT